MEEPRTGIFIDKTSGKEFRKIKYFDHDVIQDIETGWINAGKFVRDVGRMNGINKKLSDFKATDDYKLCLEIQSRKQKDASDDIFITYNEGYGNDVKGSYTSFQTFQLIALWVDKRHKLDILDLIRTNETIQESYPINKPVEVLVPSNSNLINSNGHQFIQTTWNGISVIRDTETGYYYANKMARDNGKQIKNLIVTKDYEEEKQAISEVARIPATSLSYEIYKVHMFIQICFH